MMDHKELVSVVIPAYNCEKTIERCLCSVLVQSWPHLEIVAINDGSSDRTGEILDQFARQDARVHVLHQKNEGVARARDRGTAKARGEYLIYLDSDDWIGKDYIRNFLEAARAAGADVCICGLTEVSARRTHAQKAANPACDLAPKSAAGSAADTSEFLRTLPDADITAIAPELSDVTPDLAAFRLRRIHPGSYEKNTGEASAYRMMSACSRFYRTAFLREHQLCFDAEKTVRGEDIPVALYANYFAPTIAAIDQTEYYYFQHADSARHQLRGLRHETLPYRQLSAVAKKARETYLQQMAQAGHARQETGTASAEKIHQDAAEASAEKITQEAAQVPVTRRIPAGQETSAAKRIRQHWYFFEFGLVKTMAQMTLDLGAGASLQVKRQMYRWQAQTMKAYCPDWRDNPYLKLKSGLPVPFWLKCAISLYLFFYRIWICRFDE